MSRVILITGLPGTGKSTLAGQVAAHFGVPLVTKDLIKEPLLDVIGAQDAAQSRQLSDASFAVLFALARSLVVAGCSVVLEGNFRPGEHEAPLRAALPLLDEVGSRCGFAQVLCRVDEGERAARIRARQATAGRHVGHRHCELLVGGRVDAFLDLPGERFVHDGADSARVLALLDEWWKMRAISRPVRQMGEQDR